MWVVGIIFVEIKMTVIQISVNFSTKTVEMFSKQMKVIKIRWNSTENNMINKIINTERSAVKICCKVILS